ncbi:hypothetical protein AHF37_02701 [Paragonimus kellicotti]|nr:hypothetical protein AHF37_02701 [Paragonimus kellicotti]
MKSVFCISAMGRRFYCDYCDKSFPNNPVNRRTHLNGMQHQQLRKLHYEQYLDPPQRLAIEKAKKSCTTFLRTGECSYGLLCRFSHQTPDMMRCLEELAKEQLDSTSYLIHLVS